MMMKHFPCRTNDSRDRFIQKKELGSFDVRRQQVFCISEGPLVVFNALS